MPATINGSPTHVLIVHVIVVLLPLAVLASLMLVLVPASRRAYALPTLLVAFVGCIAIPLAFLSGSELRARVPPSPLINQHVALAHQLIVVAAVYGVSLAAFVAVDLVRRARIGRLNLVEHRLATATGISGYARNHRLSAAYRLVAALLVVMSLATAVEVVRVGDSGAKAAWHGRLSAPR